ncbi:phage major capsid protein [Limnoglobus roseus]|uniref:Phage major capsid protein n=1 Tax=Limnoglobus roseus TaxID=2598579 RepID=A0A5C1AA13_9BACT|nr:phage major capsid protein [Limnoglobus roseus]QEL13878.1 phage major capsid protein [Limnoglobus roseus]
MNDLTQLKESRAKLLHDAKSIIQTAKGEGRDLNGDESKQVEGMYADFDKFGERLNTLEKTSKLEQAEAELKVAYRKTSPTTIRTPEEKPDLGNAIRSWMLTGTDTYRATPEALDNAARCGVNLNSSRASVRMLSTASTTGQQLVQWKEFTDAYERYLKYYGAVVNVVTQIGTETGVPLPIPVFDDTNNTGRWLSEGTTVTSTDPTVSSVSLGAWKLSSDEIPVSIELIQDSQTALDQLLPLLLAERMGRALNNAVTVGDGSSKPRGILLDATASGVVTTGTGAAPTVSIDNLLDLKYSVDKAYRDAPSATKGFMMHDKFLAQVRKSKDGQNRYFADPFQSGPGTLDGEPIIINNDMPSSGVNAKLVAYGDYSKYWLRNVLDIQFLKLSEVRARDGMVCFLAFARYDGRLINPNAVKYVAAPAS